MRRIYWNFSVQLRTLLLLLAALAVGQGPPGVSVWAADAKPEQKNVQVAVGPRIPLPSLDRVEQEAEACLTAADAVTVFKLFLARPDLSQDLRRAAEGRLIPWRDREKQGLVRVGDEWITNEQYEQRKKIAQDLVAEARAFLKLGDVKKAEQELAKASETKADQGDAELMLGLIDCFVYDDDLAGMKHFRESASRNPGNIAASNNAAVAGFYARRTTQIAKDFQLALERAGNAHAQKVVDNIAFIIASREINSRHCDQLKELYQAALREMRLGPPEPEKPGDAIRTAPYFLVPRDWRENVKDDEQNPRRGVAADDAVLVGFGTGFVIAPHLIVTNHHVIANANEIAIMNPEDHEQLLLATVVSSDAELDLALLECPQLSAPAIGLRRTLPGRGSDLMTLGYPHASLLGRSIKSTRGAVVSLPAKSEDRFLHDAVVNPGNSGGPLVDRSGFVIGVTVAYLTRYAVDNAYFVGIPVDALWGFLAKSGRGALVAPADGGEQLNWPDVDARASRSTVLIQCKSIASGAKEH